MLEQLYPLLISLLIGLFIGIEREHSHPAGSQAMGVRTFTLVALFGTLAAMTDIPGLTFSASLFAFAAILLSYHKSSRRKGKNKTFGLTTEIAAAIVFFLGYLTPEKPLLAAVIGISVLLTLVVRSELHTFSRNTVKTKEIYAAVAILIIGLAILPFLPNRVIDAWQIFNPRQYATLVLILSIIQFLGYIAIRNFGNRLGLLLTAFFSGLVSSTSVFLILTKLSQDEHQPKPVLIASALLATNAMLIEIIILLSLISHELILKLLIPIASMIAVGFLSVWPVIKTKQEFVTIPVPENPLDLKSIFKLATFIAVMMALISLAKQTIGQTGVKVISFLGGLFEVHSVNIANASLFAHMKLSLHSATQAIGLAIIATFITKFFLLWSLSNKQFALRTSIFLILMLIVGSGTFLTLVP